MIECCQAEPGYTGMVVQPPIQFMEQPLMEKARLCFYFRSQDNHTNSCFFAVINFMRR